MALSEQELKIAQQIKDQGGTEEDFLDVLQQIRGSGEEPEQPVEAEKPKGIDLGISNLSSTFNPLSEILKPKEEYNTDPSMPLVLTKKAAKEQVKPFTNIENFVTGAAIEIPKTIAQTVKSVADPLGMLKDVSKGSGIPGVEQAVNTGVGFLKNIGLPAFGNPIAGDIAKKGVELAEKGTDLVTKLAKGEGYDPESLSAKAGGVAVQVAPMVFGALKAAGKSAIEKTLESMIPKKFSAKVLETLKEAGKVKPSGITGKKYEYIPDARDKEIAEVATPFVKGKKTTVDKVQALKKGIGMKGEALEEAVGGNNAIIPKKVINSKIDEAVAEIMDHPEMQGENKLIAEKLITKFKNMVNEEGGSSLGVLRARKRFDSYINEIRPKTFDDPKNTVYDVTVRAIRNKATKIVDESVTDVSVKKALREQSLLYEAKDMFNARDDLNWLGRLWESPVTRFGVGAGIGAGGAGGLGVLFNE